MPRNDLSHPAAGDAQAGIVELVRRLSDDSRRLARDEIRLAKLEMADSLRAGGRGAMVMSVAFGAGVIALSALTICVIAVLGLAMGKVWVAALVTGVVEIGLGFLLMHRGARDLEGVSPAAVDGAAAPQRVVRVKTSGVTTSGRAD